MLSQFLPSVCPSVTRVDQSKTDEVKISGVARVLRAHAEQSIATPLVKIMQFSPTVARSLWFLSAKFRLEIVTGSP